ncbi:MAG: hypothetical protein LC659_16025, partial [Myxococcales bacterium]|nr:hypothetical protein [Myxococcales bacterium]
MPLPLPDEAARRPRLLAVGLATGAALLAMTLAITMIRGAPPLRAKSASTAPVAVGGNGIVLAPPSARPRTPPVELRVTTWPTRALVASGAHDIVA